MTEVMLALIQTHFRGFLNIAIGYIGIFTMMFTMVKARKHLWILIIFSLTKSVYSQIITGELVYMSGQLHQILPLLNAVVLPILDAMLLCLFCKAPAFKVLPTMIIAEVIGIILMISSFAVVNVIEGRSDPLMINGMFMWEDLLIPLVYAILFSVIYYFIRPLLLRYRSYEFRHPTIPLIIFCVYYVSMSGTYMMDYGNVWELNIFYYMVVIVWALFLFLIGDVLYRQIRKKTMLESDRLRLQQELMNVHYMAVRQQDMEESSRLLEAQMDEILSMDLSTISSQRIEEYLQHLRASRDRMHAGIYCNDWLIDAVLYCQGERIRKQGKKLICDIHGFTLGAIKEQDLAQLLFRLLELACEKADGEIALSMTTVRNQLILTLRTVESGKRKRKKAMPLWIKDYLKKYNGYIDKVWQGDVLEMTISLQAHN